ncbi:hypothetical protein H5410_052385 [Solanum commersonii]|uniref:Uncharacterized protein n=1 Tax=Solanum commersonii TaxID=4109 RepID=A0A9J5X3G8_SOLCO|nr:hypothetical protein H5410_052385 [Solanum commersonii]
MNMNSEYRIVLSVLVRCFKPSHLTFVSIDVMSNQIAKLTATLAKSEQRRVVEQESMSAPFSKSKNKC